MGFPQDHYLQTDARRVVDLYRPSENPGMIEVARLLAGHYEAITVYRFPDGLYEKFKQVVVLAYKRKLYQPPTDKEVLSLQSLATEDLEPIETAVEPIYELLSAPSRGANGKPIVFKRTDWEPEEVVEAKWKRCSQDKRMAGSDLSDPWINSTRPTGHAVEKGHIAMLMASGMMGTVRLTDEDGKPMLIKGRVSRWSKRPSSRIRKMQMPSSRPSKTGSLPLLRYSDRTASRSSRM
jgi:hypothetical protein